MAVESEREMMVMVWKLLVARRAERISVPIVPLAWKGFVLLGKCCGIFVQQWGFELTPTRAMFLMCLEEEVMVGF